MLSCKPPLKQLSSGAFSAQPQGSFVDFLDQAYETMYSRLACFRSLFMSGMSALSGADKARGREIESAYIGQVYDAILRALRADDSIPASV